MKVTDKKQLWERYQRERSPQTRQALIEAYAGLTRYVVERLNLRPGPSLDYEDLLGQAAIGLIEAFDRYDPKLGIKFETFAYHRIRGAVIDMLRELDWLPRLVRQREAQLVATFERLQATLGHPPADSEVASALGITEDQLDEWARDVALQSLQSLDEIVSGDAGEFATLGDLVRDQQHPTPDGSLLRRVERELLTEAIDTLPDTERTVIGLYYYNGLTFREIGQTLGVTESRTCQIHAKAMVRMRAHVQAQLRLPAEEVQTSPAESTRRSIPVSVGA